MSKEITQETINKWAETIYKYALIAKDPKEKQERRDFAGHVMCGMVYALDIMLDWHAACIPQVVEAAFDNPKYDRSIAIDIMQMGWCSGDC